MKKIIIMLVMSALLSTNTANAASSGQVKAFLESVGCQFLPTGTCEALNVNNAKNLFTSVKASYLQKFCGTKNINAAKQMLQIDQAIDATKCKKVIDLW